MRRILCSMLIITSLLVGCGINAVSVKSEGQMNFKEAFSTNIRISQESDVVLFDISLENKSEQEVELTFPSSQFFELLVIDDKKKEVYRYSEGKLFTEAIETKSIAPGQQISFHDEWEIQDEKAGKYTAIVQLKATNLNKDEIRPEVQKIKKDFELREMNSAFRDVNVTGENGLYKINGEARVFEGSFYFSVEEGHEYLIKEKNIKVQHGAPNWSPFEIEINIKKEQLPTNGTLTAILYERSAKDGYITNPFYAPLETIGEE